MKNILKNSYLLLVLAAVLGMVADYFLPGSGVAVMAGTAITTSRFSDAKEIQSYTDKGIKAYDQVFAATSAWVAKSAHKQIVSYAQLTGAITINATLTALNQWDEVVFIFEADSSQRVVTFGTGFISSGTVTVTAAKGATVRAIYDGTSLRVYAREIYA